MKRNPTYSAKYFLTLILFLVAGIEGLGAPLEPSSAPGDGTTLSGKVVGVTDGDTIQVLVDGRELKVRS